MLLKLLGQHTDKVDLRKTSSWKKGRKDEQRTERKTQPFQSEGINKTLIKCQSLLVNVYNECTVGCKM